MQDTLYAFVMKGELTKIALANTGVVSRHSSSELLAQEYINSLSGISEQILDISNSIIVYDLLDSVDMNGE